MRIRRKVRLDTRRLRQKEGRRRTAEAKRQERVRRDRRLAAKLREGRVDAPEVQSWIAAKLGKPAARASAEELERLKA